MSPRILKEKFMHICHINTQINNKYNKKYISYFLCHINCEIKILLLKFSALTSLRPGFTDKVYRKLGLRLS